MPHRAGFAGQRPPLPGERFEPVHERGVGAFAIERGGDEGYSGV